MSRQLQLRPDDDSFFSAVRLMLERSADNLRPSNLETYGANSVVGHERDQLLRSPVRRCRSAIAEFYRLRIKTAHRIRANESIRLAWALSISSLRSSNPPRTAALDSSGEVAGDSDIPCLDLCDRMQKHLDCGESVLDMTQGWQNRGLRQS